MRIRLLILLSVLSFAAVGAAAQIKPKTSLPAVNPVKSSPAYAEVLLRKTELSAELESLLIEYTEEYPKVKDLRFEVSLLQKELDRLLGMSPDDTGKLSAALGKMMVRKCELAVDVWNLQKDLQDEHPDLKRAKRRLEIFERSIAEILQGK